MAEEGLLNTPLPGRGGGAYRHLLPCKYVVCTWSLDYRADRRLWPCVEGMSVLIATQAILRRDEAADTVRPQEEGHNNAYCPMKWEVNKLTSLAGDYKMFQSICIQSMLLKLSNKIVFTTYYVQCPFTEWLLKHLWSNLVNKDLWKLVVLISNLTQSEYIIFGYILQPEFLLLLYYILTQGPKCWYTLQDIYIKMVKPFTKVYK